MRIREPRAGWMGFLWLWATVFGGIPLFILVTGATSEGGAPLLFLLLFPTIAVAVMVPMVRRSTRAGFVLDDDGIHGAHDAETDVVPWDEVDRIAWRWAEETSGVKVNGRPLPDGYALHAMLRDGRAVRLMQRVAAKYGQQQDLNEQLVRAGAAGALPVPFDATIPTHGEGEWSGTPPPPSRRRSGAHTSWGSGDLPPAGNSPLDDGAGAADGAADVGDVGDVRDDGPVWPTG